MSHLRLISCGEEMARASKQTKIALAILGFMTLVIITSLAALVWVSL